MLFSLFSLLSHHFILFLFSLILPQTSNLSSFLLSLFFLLTLVASLFFSASPRHLLNLMSIFVAMGFFLFFYFFFLVIWYPIRQWMGWNGDEWINGGGWVGLWVGKLVVLISVLICFCFFFFFLFWWLWFDGGFDNGWLWVDFHRLWWADVGGWQQLWVDFSGCGFFLFSFFFFFFGDCGRNNFSGCGFFFFKFYFNKVVLVVVGLCRGGCRCCCSNGCWWPLLRQWYLCRCCCRWWWWWGWI